MLLNHLFYALHGFIAALIVHTYQAEGNNQKTTNHCAEFNDICDLHLPQACCDNKLTCKQNKSENNFICQKRVMLDGSCDSDEDCSDIFHAKCATGKTCICKSNNTQVNETYCAPTLGSFCSEDEQCATDHSSCIDNKCQCDDNYSQNSDDQCSPVLIVSSCDIDFDCERIEFAKCSADKHCICSSNTETVNGTCVPILNNFCLTDDDCHIDNSECFNFECKCKSMFKATSNTECREPSLGMSCDIENDCRQIKFSTCSDDNECICKSNYIKSDLSTCSPLIHGNCTKNEDCVTENSYCFRNRCQCIENYFAHSDDLCTPISLITPCQTNEDCEMITNSFCSMYKRCFCSSGYMAINETKCVLPLNKFCAKNKPCVAKNSICINNKCQCRSGFFNHLNAECSPRRLYEYCEENSDCPSTGQDCSNHRCVCKDNYIALDSTNKCASLLNGDCSKNKDCYVKNSICVEKKCQCDLNHLPNSNYECELFTLGKLCVTNTDCQIIENSRCSADNVCDCGMNYFAFGKFRCLSTLSGFCLKDNDCYSDLFHCSDNRCQCKTNYTAVSVDRCVETHSLSSCTDVLECSDSWHSTCSPEGRCVCALNNIALRPSTCLPTLNGYCWKDDQCMAENSVCIDFRCQCKSNFIAVANNLCISIK